MKLVAAMIVKNEAAVLHRCFNSLVPHVKRIIINDNGSTDETPSIISQLDMAVEVPGDWIDFATNRNVVLSVARQWGDYVLCGIDADEELVVPPDFAWPDSGADAYSVDIDLQGTVYPRVAIVSSAFPWEWRYPVHEGLYPVSPTLVPRIEHIPGVFIRSHRDGARSRDPETAGKDLVALLHAVGEDPDNPRLTFYIAQMYRDLRNYDAAAHWYLKRTLLGGYDQEVWYSHYMLARISDWMNSNPVRAYLDVWERNPARAEPLYRAADWCRRQDEVNQALMFALAAHAIKAPPKGALFVEQDVYDWRVLDLIATVAYYTPHVREGALVLHELIQRAPQSELPRITKNAGFYAQVRM